LQLLAAIRQLDDCRPGERFRSFSANANPLADRKNEVDVIWSVESGISPLSATSPIPRRSASAMCLASASQPTTARAADIAEVECVCQKFPFVAPLRNGPRLLKASSALIKSALE
jgi:hypothetical protein